LPGIVTTALEPATALSEGYDPQQGLGLLCTLVVCGGISMFINDTPVMKAGDANPAEPASKTGVPASQIIDVLNAAVLLGG
jgi:hypothetical protein